MIARTLQTLALVLVFPAIACGAHWPSRTFTTADGLGHNAVNRIVQDSRGFIWFCTREGLSRFNGREFVTYGMEHGLPSAFVNDVLETRDGVYWVATSRGVARFDPAAADRAGHGASTSSMFTSMASTAAAPLNISVLFEDSQGQVWVGTLTGLFRLSRSGLGPAQLIEMDVGLGAPVEVLSLAEHGPHGLWIGTSVGLCLLRTTERAACYTVRQGLPGNFVQALRADPDGRVWVGTTDGGLALVAYDPEAGAISVQRVFTRHDGLGSTWINEVFRGADGRVWVGTAAGIARIDPDGSGSPTGFRASAVPVAVGSGARAIAQDRNHYLWIGTITGAVRVQAGGVTVFTAEDGVPAASSLLETSRGEIVAMTAGVTAEGGVRFRDRRVGPFRLPIQRAAPSWGWNQMMLIDRQGDWWFGTRSGALRVSGDDNPDYLERARVLNRFTQADGLASDVIIRMFEDSRGDIWIATVGEGGPGGVSRWNRSANRLHHYRVADGLPDPARYFVSAFAEDRAGNVWMGFSADGGLARVGHDRIVRFGADAGPLGAVRNLMLSDDGTLWAATSHAGLLRVASPPAADPTVSRITVANGLSSNDVGAVAEDRAGRIYAATARSIDRIDLRSWHIRRQPTGEGLPSGDIYAALRDREGVLWFGCHGGLIRLEPVEDPPINPPTVLIDSLVVNTQRWPVSAMGQTDLGGFTLPAGRAALQVGYIAPGLGSGDVRYQLMLGGMDSEWGAPSDQHSASYVNIGPGRYRFMVRAMNGDGVVSRNVASVEFRVLAPVWQRWWFVSMAFALVLGAGNALWRYRLSRLLQIADMRARIATDLHDDIGANLTRIAVLTEVVRRQRTDTPDATDARLSAIATVARESMTAMSDIVWAIHPERDRLDELTRRMREYAEELCAAADIRLTFMVPAGNAVRLGTEARRDLYLFFKEAANNVARHSGCTNFQVEMRVLAGRLQLVLADDGRGFDPEVVREGHGLASMRRRSARMGGEVTFVSQRRTGTTIRLNLPIALRRRATSPGR
jgi:ligand-binding sensor domain-containing protein